MQQTSLTWPMCMLRCTHRGRERVIAWKRVAVRAGMLFVLALVLGELGEWNIQILHYHALWLLLLLLLSVLRVTLLIIAGVLAVICPAFKIAADHAAASWGFLPGMEPVTASEQPVGKWGSADRRQRCAAGARSCGAPWVVGE
ncbi:hypothetical protein FCH28_03160 [Streptomyces piniterrae]|uniref:Uncharacterized protein n=1 Tax=Streptomyces piniterrae TaxID=2571125 RepID=A0A4U0NY57_9ACTN|nr:hypothetical protein [Streptomyces piniterrae]TJZ59132.1 hypothetical protein FCH28_03160 [Streptomyces piniterrae]